MSEHTLDYERLALGILISHPSVKDDMDMSVDDFSLASNRLILKTINEMLDSGLQVDLMLLAHQLESISSLSKVGGMSYLSGLVSSAPAKENAKSFANIVKHQAVGRDLVQKGSQINAILSSPGNSEAKLTEVESIFSSIELAKSSQLQQYTIGQALGSAIDFLNDKEARKGQEPEFAFGFEHLDEMTCGVSPEDLVIIAGRPSMGKTAFAMNVVERLCCKGKVGLVMSVEMSAAQLALRMISSSGLIDAQRIRKAELDEDDYGRLSFAMGHLNNLPLFIDETAGPSPSQVRRAAKQVIRQQGRLDFIAIDYLQLMSGDKPKYDNRGSEISDITRCLKLLAKQLHVPIYLLSQLNRSLESRQNKRPVMSDLRESGSIEQDADLILFIYRDEVYNPDSPDKGYAEIIVSKQRNGPIGHVQTRFRGEFSKFEDVRRLS